jgi:3-oxoacyl-[acyl-carrier-protein] synthase-3
MGKSLDDLTAHLLDRVALVRSNLGYEPDAVQPTARFADLLDSMGMVEFLTVVARDLGVAPGAVEEAVGHRFGTVAEVAERLAAAGLVLAEPRASPAEDRRPGPAPLCWLAATAVRLPDTVQPAADLNAALHRPAGWLERHAGIRSRRVWRGQDPLAAAAEAGREALDRSGVLPEEMGALLVASEAPPRLLGLAAALHAALGLRPGAAALEVGGACTGFLTAVWLLHGLLARLGTAVVVALEAPSHFLTVRPGPAGEAAALFGDAAIAAVLAAGPTGADSVPVSPILLGADGSGANLVTVSGPPSRPEVHMEGRLLAGRAVRAMADAVRDLLEHHGLAIDRLAGVVAHGGNGRMAALVGRQLDLPTGLVWSATPDLGNLGAASLPVTWALRDPKPRGLVAWTAAGAGLTWAAVLTGDTEPPQSVG